MKKRVLVILCLIAVLASSIYFVGSVGVEGNDKCYDIGYEQTTIWGDTPIDHETYRIDGDTTILWDDINIDNSKSD